ncbi:2-hydroxyacid dehydrogenase [Variovorax sp. J22P271]|uniref:2-hydroxyacid dehydrogenase n=1 Tax=Variovorax davisae TaxID=3053515 RepID=UPI0025775F93|nr:2-hydroxyacid dehydrogenase [Variovorax sp. J22P271]MDM0032385.1 2-hydroxyacid dehydrogenase [Variovorax sp. J22P271]
MAPVHVVFLYSARFAPVEIHPVVAGAMPANCTIEMVEQNASPARRLEAMRRADVVLAYPGNPSPTELRQAGRLKLFQLMSAGYDWLDLTMFRDAGIPLANNGGANATTTAEHALLLILAALKRLPLHHEAMRRGEWLGMRETASLRELHGKVLGIIGLGRIGRHVARLAVAFGAQVIYFSPARAPIDVEQELNARLVTLEQLLRDADVVSLHASLSAHNRRMIDRQALTLMKPSSILINVARGALVDEAALIEALRSGRIAAAGLDVFEHEPLTGDSPLLALDNVVFTPHVAGVTVDTWGRRLAHACQNIERVMQGEPPLSRVV